MLPLSAFRKFIADKQLFSPEERVLLAVSGGRDSVLMARLFHAAGYNFSIIHCNFGLRGAESERDEAFVCRLAAELGVPFLSRKFDTRAYAKEKQLSIQMAARELRYQWFEEQRVEGGFACIALAQHQTDLVETVLINQLRGTGISGMHGIRSKNGKLIRPLLFLTAAGIHEIARSCGMGWVEDSSNASTDYQRNKIRQEVLPVLRQINPSLEATFSDNAARMEQAERLLGNTVAALRKSFIHDGPLQKLPLELVRSLDPQELLLFELLRPFGFHAEAVTRIISVLDAPSGRQFFSSGHRLIKDRNHLVIEPVQIAGTTTWILQPDDEAVIATGWTVSQHAGLPGQPPDEQHVAWCDRDKLVYPLTLRFWQQGDRFRPLGMKGFKKVSDFFVDRKLSLAEKERVPLLVNGNGDIVWVAGMRLDDRYKVGPGTEKVIIFEFKINPVGR
ncbi:tRNA lysidine(34) synthetase TilS [Pedobacter yulinensis]|uniref:tRNA(Ile)-lysidine synthase n=1 Tax=Pedobacter yulinensis TaxID=2126353 RepID=A0A2T3HP53_9SPHI|nr:tRNA lysidine(34) synthetase TilS [Pedobacter yulinensis]PST84187.1 tRNA lysidine(34) synthetase TilS [Pedobacter yulinensis]